MYRIILPLLIILRITITFADSATQTDWSGGDGVLGPVLDWESEFLQSWSILWVEFPGSLHLPDQIEYTVTNNFGGASSVITEDIDNDGDQDVIGAAYSYDAVAWWENTNGQGTEWQMHMIDTAFNGAFYVYAKDIDGDLDVDVIGSSSISQEIRWWENLNGVGTEWYQRTVADVPGVKHVFAEDINDDGKMDIISSSDLLGDVIWWDNTTGSGTEWTENLVDDSAAGARSVMAEDIDGDGDMDITGAITYLDEFAWWENLNGQGTSWAKHTLSGPSPSPMSLYAMDIDDDGFTDLVGATNGDSTVAWWENLNGTGTAWTKHIIDGELYSPSSIHADDIDNDGDMDVLGASYYGYDIVWWQNSNGSGTAWNKYLVSEDFPLSLSVNSTDLDGDNTCDVVGTSFLYSRIAWWNLTPAGYLESSILDTQSEPSWDYLEWNSQAPPETSVSFQVRASDDHTSMGVWSDTLSIPCLLQGILTDGDQYVQYRVILETSDPDTTPALFELMLTWDPMGVSGGEDPVILALLPFSPNPASLPAVRFSLPEPASVELSVFDLSGRLVDVLEDVYPSGYGSILLDVLSPGIYFCRMTSGDFKATQRFVVIE